MIYDPGLFEWIQELPQFMQPEEGNKYIFLKFAIKNNSDTDKSMSFYSFSCYADGYQCDMYCGNDDALSASLSSGRTSEGSLVFEVPKDAVEIEVEYEDMGSLSNGLNSTFRANGKTWVDPQYSLPPMLLIS